MNINQLSEQLKDVPQNRLVDYAKNPNSVVPQFLALAEIQRRQQLSAQAQPPQSTVANDVLSQAQPAPMVPQGLAGMQPQPQQMAQMAQQLPENQQGVTQLPSRMAPEGFAGGGIVAFAKGGMNLSLDDEEDTETEDQELARLFPVESTRMRYLSSAIPEGVQSLIAGLPKSYEATKKEYASEAPTQSKEGIQALLHKLGHIESGNKDYDKYGRLITSPKGAEGRMQTLRSTQRDPGFGVTPARDSSVEEKNRVGEDYFKAMLERFKDPKIAAMAYNWGPGNVQKWLESGKTIPVPQETIKHASHFAAGGSVPRFNGTQGPSIVGPSGEPIEDFLEKNPEKPKAEKVLTESEKTRARDLASAEEQLRKNAARAAEMKTPKVNPSVSGAKPPPAHFESSPVGRGQKLLGSTIIPYGVYEGGRRATEGAASVIAPQAFSSTREHLMGAGGGDDTALAAAIMQNADYTKPDSDWSKALRNNPISNYLFGTSGTSPVAPQSKAPASPSSSPPSASSAAPSAPTVPPSLPTTPAQQSAQDKYFELASKQIEEAAANLAKQGKMNAALSVLSAGFGMLKSKSPYLLGGVGEGGQEGVGTFAALNKQQNEGLKDLMAARLGLAKTGASAGYANEMLGLKRVDIARDNLQQYLNKRMAEIMAMPGGELNKNYAAAKAAIFRDPVYIQLAKDAQVPYTESAPSGPAGPKEKPLGAFQSK